MTRYEAHRNLAMLVTCPCGCPRDAHVGEVGCPCGLPDEKPCRAVNRADTCPTCRGTGIQPDYRPNPELVPCETCAETEAVTDDGCPRCGQFICDDRARCDGLRTVD